jgi:hypothetical protein
MVGDDDRGYLLELLLTKVWSHTLGVWRGVWMFVWNHTLGVLEGSVDVCVESHLGSVEGSVDFCCPRIG